MKQSAEPPEMISHNGRGTANIDPPEQSVHSRFGRSTRSNSSSREPASSSIHNINNNARGHIYMDGEASHASSSVGPQQRAGGRSSRSRSRDPDSSSVVGPRTGGRGSISRSRDPDTGRSNASSALDNHLSKNNHSNNSNRHNHSSTESLGDPPNDINEEDGSSEDSSFIASKQRIDSGSTNYHFPSVAPPIGNHQRMRNSVVLNTSSHGGYNDRRTNTTYRDMQNHQRSRQPAKKDKDSDLEALGGYSNHPNRVKFADQMFGPQSDQKSNYSAPWRDRSISSSNASKASVGNTMKSVRSEHSKSSIDSHGDDDPYYSSASLDHRIHHYGYLKKNAAFLAVVSALMMATTVNYFGGSLVGDGSRTMDAQRGLTNEHDMRDPVRGIMDDVHPVINQDLPQAADDDGGIRGPEMFNDVDQQEQPVDWNKVPPHLRGYYSKLLGVGEQFRGVQRISPEQQMLQQEQLQIQNEMQRQIMDAQQKAIQSIGNEGMSNNEEQPESSRKVPVIDLKEFERQQEELERNAGTGLDDGNENEGETVETTLRQDADDALAKQQLEEIHQRQQGEAAGKRATKAERQRAKELKAYQDAVKQQTLEEQEAAAAEGQQQAQEGSAQKPAAAATAEQQAQEQQAQEEAQRQQQAAVEVAEFQAQEELAKQQLDNILGKIEQGGPVDESSQQQAEQQAEQERQAQAEQQAQAEEQAQAERQAQQEQQAEADAAQHEQQAQQQAEAEALQAQEEEKAKQQAQEVEQLPPKEDSQPPQEQEQPPPPPSMELPTEAEMEVSRQKAAEEAQRIEAEEEARQKLAQEESLRKAATAMEDQRLAQEQAILEVAGVEQPPQEADADVQVEEPGGEQMVMTMDPNLGEDNASGEGVEEGGGGDGNGAIDELTNELADLMALLQSKKG